MAQIIGLLILLFLIGVVVSTKQTEKGVARIKRGVNNVREQCPGPTHGGNNSRVIALLERLHIEGYVFGPRVGDATPGAPAVVHDAELSAFVQRLMADSTLEQVLPRIGFCVRSTASCHDTTLSRQYPRMLVTPTLHAIGYRPG